MIKNIVIFFATVLLGFGIVFVYYEVVSFPLVSIQIPNITSFVHNSLFSLVKAPSESIVGNIIMLSGDVEYQSRVATDSAKIYTPQIIQQGEKLNTGPDGAVEIQFGNYSQILMHNDTQVEFAQTLPQNIVCLQTMGGAIYKKTDNTPVSIRTLHLLSEINGGAEISLDKIKPLVKIKVLDGSITIAFNNIDNVSRVITFQKGKTITFNDKTRKVVVE